MEGISFRRRLFGFKTDDVREALADREELLARALERAESAERRLGEADEAQRSAEAKLAELRSVAAAAREEVDRTEAEVVSLRSDVERLSAELAASTEEIERLRTDVRAAAEATGDVTLQFLVNDVAPVLEAAKESASALVTKAQAYTEERVAEVKREEAELESRVGAFRSWSGKLHEVVGPARERIDEATTRIGEVPKRIEEALAPLTELLAEFGQDLDRLAGMTGLAPFAGGGLAPTPVDLSDRRVGIDESRATGLSESEEPWHEVINLNGGDGARWIGTPASWPSMESTDLPLR